MNFKVVDWSMIRGRSNDAILEVIGLMKPEVLRIASRKALKNKLILVFFLPRLVICLVIVQSLFGAA